jgi:hypothetical protein
VGMCRRVRACAGVCGRACAGVCWQVCLGMWVQGHVHVGVVMCGQAGCVIECGKDHLSAIAVIVLFYVMFILSQVLTSFLSFKYADL